MINTNLQKPSAFFVEAINADGEQRTWKFFPTEVSKMKKLFESLNRSNQFLSIRISISYTVISLERAMTNDYYNYTRTMNGKTETRPMKDINDIFKR